MLNPKARRAAVALTPQVVSSVVMCGCPMATPFGWMVVWRAILHSVPVPCQGFPPEPANEGTYEYLERLASVN